MSRLRVVLPMLLALFVVGVLSGCQATKDPGMMIGTIQGKTDDETAIYTTLGQVQQYISAGAWDKWLALYSDDAVLTLGDKKVSKEEMRKAVDGLKYTITDMEVLQKVIGKDDAFVSTKMLGNGKEHLESYKFKKIDGTWLIVEEMNP